MITVFIDELTPCLKDVATGKVLPTTVTRITEPSCLRQFTKRNGWYTNWRKLLLTSDEVYALYVSGNPEVQGLVALHSDEDQRAVFVSWMCAAPKNNKLLNDEPVLSGVGGHLFAVAAHKSVLYGYNGALTGFAANMRLVEHYKDKFKAEHIGMLHPYQILIDENSAKNIMEVYDYEETNLELL